MRSNIILYLTFILVVFLLGWTGYKELSKPDIAYIDIEKLVSAYNYKKDLEKDASKNLYTIKHAIDSLELVQKTINSPQPTIVDSQLARAKYIFEQYYSTSTQQMNKSIWERLNPIIENYGKERKLKLLIGANGTGSLLYADKKRDMTNDLITYINENYEKGN